ncbi:putative methyltransferase DDB_G0268948 [Betta splendens]|uniref:Methyltransferase DDB_G0268948 n=1 Tax=Betta splendens TaxID=158456 RepID=A0A6P7LG45_BETSP|nr:putative methyltransferase DDB_G0268948 [Betta splendens]
MAYRMFEGKDHACLYQKYRFTPPDQLKTIVLQYLDKKKGRPHVLAVDVGCGTGQNSRVFAADFKEVMGVDVSESQLEEARAVPGFPNVTYRSGTAEELPVADGSVDLLTAATAAHWFDQSRFLTEADRVLKSRGCLALMGFNDNDTKLQYQNCGENLNRIYEEVKQVLTPYKTTPVDICESKLEALYTAIPYPDKDRIEGIKMKIYTPLQSVLGFIETWSMFQTYKKNDPQAANELVHNAQKRFLEEMGVTDPDTKIEYTMEYYCVLASKP